MVASAAVLLSFQDAYWDDAQLPADSTVQTRLTLRGPWPRFVEHGSAVF